MYKVLLIFPLLLFPVFAFPQSGFVFKYSTLNDETPSGIVETSDHGFMICGSKGTYPDSYHTLLIRINMYGDSEQIIYFLLFLIGIAILFFSSKKIMRLS